jgi:invasion protein IalB
MTHSGITGALCALVLAGLAAAPAAVLAQEAAPAAAEATAAPQQGTPESPWVKICNADQEAQGQRCNVSQVLLAQNGSVIASFSIQVTPDNKIAAGAFVPLGFVLPAGVGLFVDGEQKATANFTICVPPSSDGPAGCAARADLSEEFIASLKKGNKLGLVLANTQGQAIPIEMTLIGFSKTYDGEGLDPVAARAAEVEQSRQLQEDARAAFQRMIERQQAESGTSPN